MFSKLWISELLLNVLKLIIWHLDSIVGGIFSTSVVANMKTVFLLGSSKVFKSALKAALESM